MTIEWLGDIGPATETRDVPSKQLQIVPKLAPPASHERVLRLIARVREDRIARPLDVGLMEIQTELHRIHFAQCEEVGT